MLYWIKTPKWIKRFFTAYEWQIPTAEKWVYLTFDDGPIPEVTPWVLDQLAAFQAKASFFCIGDNISKHPDIFQRIIAEGHAVGNHTHNHLNAWSTTASTYLNNVQICQDLIDVHYSPQGPKLLRPPYGKITPTLTTALKNQGYRLIMWDILTADFDVNVSPAQCAENAISKIENGSIIIFHDSKKAYPNLEYALPLTLRELHLQGYTFRTL